MFSCLSGSELEPAKSPPSQNNSSPSSTLISESNSSPPVISTRRPRTPRKRQNQTYEEAAALLSTAYPNIFSSKKISKTHIFGINKSPLHDYNEDSQLLLPYESIIDEPDILFSPMIPTKAEHCLEQKEVNVGGEIDDSDVNRLDDFDVESILEEEIEEGIESFMGNTAESDHGGDNCYRIKEMLKVAWYGRFRLGIGLRSALRENEDSNCLKFSTVEFDQISPKTQTTTTTEGDNKKKKNNKKKTVAPVESKISEDPPPKLEQRVSPLLKLDYDGVLEACSAKQSLFSEEILVSDAAGIDLRARLGEIDLFGESGIREASLLRYKHKRRNRLFEKKYRYQVRKIEHLPMKKG